MRIGSPGAGGDSPQETTVRKSRPRFCPGPDPGKKETPFVRVCCFTLIVLLTGAPRPGAEQGSNRGGPMARRGTTPARVCGECHKEIYETWRLSMHAHAMDDPIFEATYAMAYTRTRGEAKRLCLRCHAPTTGLTRDFDQEREITREGVTCAFCHAVSTVDLSRPENPFVFTPLRNENKGRSLPGRKHPGVLASSEFCAGCHEYISPTGTVLMGTYSEWRHSPYPNQGIQGQNCHAPHEEGRVRNQGVTLFREALTTGIGPAGMPSMKTGHQEILTRLKKVERKGGNLAVTVQITNVGSGHRIPTGIPSRSLMLVCEVKTGPEGKTMVRQKIYRKKVVDRQTGKEFEDDSDLMRRPARLLEDTRLAPFETRTEEFKFMVVPDKDLVVKAYVNYVYQPVLLRKTEMKIQMSGDQKEVPAGSGN